MFACIWIIGWAFAVPITMTNSKVYKIRVKTAHTTMRMSVESTTNFTSLKWSQWSPWSPCTRSCGGGVSTQTRSCVKSRKMGSNELDDRRQSNGKICFGVSKRSRICNDEACPAGSKDFRTLQCEFFNRKPFGGVYYDWEAFYEERNECALNCRPKGYKFYATLNRSAADGTACNLGAATRNVCVGGKCELPKTTNCSAPFAVFRCGGFIGDSRSDGCGTCGGAGDGDNSTCRLVSGIFTKPYLKFGYNYVADIPRNACNVTIREMNKSNNLFALRFKNGTYVLNGERSTTNVAGIYRAAGTTFVYAKGPNGESIQTNGPLCSPLELMLVYRQTNAGIKYEYRIPTTAASTPSDDDHAAATVATLPLNENALSARRNYEMAEINELNSQKLEYFDENGKYSRGTSTAPVAEPVGNEFEYRGGGSTNDGETKRWRLATGRRRRFIWSVTNYTACSSSCGEGTRTPVYSCVKEANSRHVVAEKRCRGVEKPETTAESCTNAPCPATWVVGEWSACSVICGEGVETRQITCRREVTPTASVVVNDDACSASPPPANLLRTRPCFRKPCANGTAAVEPFWKTGVWGMCSARCGVGVQTRTVHCMAEYDDECRQSERPSERKFCDMGPCAARGSYVWLTTEWSPQCSETCGVGTRTRKVICSAAAESQQEYGCDEATRPEAVQNCSNDARCSGRWFAGSWSQCSEECGWGRQTRTTICVSLDGAEKRYSVVDDGKCRHGEKPSSEQACLKKPCQGRWFVGSWSVCTRSCDSGVERREVRCLDENSKPSADCKEEDKPATRRYCNTQKCNLYANTKDIDVGVQETQIEADRPSKRDNQNRVELFGDCKDELKNCHLVAQARLCNYDYYKSHCCISCYNYYHSTATNN